MGEYITKSGETLAQISKNTGVSVEILKKYNNITGNDNFIFHGQKIKIPDITSDLAFRIPGLSVERRNPTPEVSNNTAKATKNSKVKASVKDIELLKKHNASFDKNDPNAAAQFVEGNEVYISAANSRIPTEGDTLEEPETIKITDYSNGHKNVYYYKKLTPETMDGKFWAKADKNKPIDMSQFEEGKTYYILFLAVNEDTQERLDYTDHLEIYRLDYSYDAATDTSTYDLVQEKGMQGSGRSSIDYNKR